MPSAEWRYDNLYQIMKVDILQCGTSKQYFEIYRNSDPHCRQLLHKSLHPTSGLLCYRRISLSWASPPGPPHDYPSKIVKTIWQLNAYKTSMPVYNDIHSEFILIIDSVSWTFITLIHNHQSTNIPRLEILLNLYGTYKYQNVLLRTIFLFNTAIQAVATVRAANSSNWQKFNL